MSEKREYQRLYACKYRKEKKEKYNEYMKMYMREYKKNKNYSEEEVLTIVKNFLESSIKPDTENAPKTIRKKRSKKVIEDSSNINKFDMDDFILKKN